VQYLALVQPHFASRKTHIFIWVNFITRLNSGFPVFWENICLVSEFTLILSGKEIYGLLKMYIFFPKKFHNTFDEVRNKKVSLDIWRQARVL